MRSQSKMPLCSSFSKARARWLMACFRVRIDLAEGLLHAVGDEDRIIAEAVVAARREGQVAVHLAVETSCISPVRQRQRQAQTNLRREVGRAVVPSVRARRAPWPCGNPSSVPPSAPNRCRARRPAQSTHRPESSASADEAARIRRGARFQDSALAAKVEPVSSGSGRCSSAAPAPVRCRGAPAVP